MTNPLIAVPTTDQPLDDWLRWLETIHPVAIDMGLARVSAVADRLDLRPARKPLILVGGTNGKGSTVAMLSQIYRDAGYRTGAYTSPHITHFCERIRVDLQMVDEQQVVDALAYIERGRAPHTLTYFEYTTLAAMRVFDVLQCDVLLFEVGLGGRLDATNIWDADCSIVTSIALDHEAYLGSDVSVIATEKAAIGRAGRPFIVGELNPPPSLACYAAEHGFVMIDVGSTPANELPRPAMPGDYQRRNAGCALAAVQALDARLPVPQAAIRRALSTVSLSGRFDTLNVAGVPLILDVAHNPAGAAAVVDTWCSDADWQPLDIVFATLADKDIAGVVTALAPIVATWHCLALEVPRATPVTELASVVSSAGGAKDVHQYATAEQALEGALLGARHNKRSVLVAGSFYTIAAVMAVLQEEANVLRES